MKRVSIVLLGILLCVLLAGCQCEHEWAEATCTEPKTCTKCKETEGEPLGHNWKAATCEEPETCTRCGEQQGELADHKWKEATCEEPETCTVCGKTQGTAKGHTWKAATCTVPKTCSVCGKTEGEALGHTPGEVEMGEPDYVLATVWLNTKCTVCGEIEDRELKGLKYLYEDGKFIPSIDEFTERLGKLYPYVKDCDYTTQVVVTDDDVLGSIIADGNRDRIGTILFFNNKIIDASSRSRRSTFSGLLCEFSTENMDEIVSAILGIIMAVDPSLEESDAADAARKMVISMVSSDPYYEDGIGYVFGNADGGNYRLVVSLEN